MSRAFVKEGDSPEELPERPGGDGPNYVTPAGYSALKERFDALASERSRLSSKPGAGPTPEFRRVERDLRYYEKRLASAVVVDRSREKPDDARFGATVRLKIGEGEMEYSIVGEDEAEPAKGLLAWSAPLALALMGAKPGDDIQWDGSAARVVSVRYP